MKDINYTKKSGFAISSIIFLLFFLFLALIFVLYSINKCEEPRTFSVGAVDTKFKVQKADVIKTAQEAADRWNSQMGTTLLKYDESSSLKINLIYDERQAELDKLNFETENLEKNRQSVKSVKDQFDQMLSSFQSDLAAYNQEVSFWNKKGGASGDVYSQLEQTRLDLNKRRDQLISMSKTLNLQADGYNADLQNLQTLLDSKKNVIITQGLYKPADSQIEIYTFGNIDELKLVLMHELGHSFGIDHGKDQYSIMYYLLGDQDLTNPVLTSEDISMAKSHCSIQKISLFRYLFQRATPNIN